MSFPFENDPTIASFLAWASAQEAEHNQRVTEVLQTDANIFDDDPAAFPMNPFPTVVRMLRHFCALTGLAVAEVDEMFGWPLGSTYKVMFGEFVECVVYQQRTVAQVINITRALKVQSPEQDFKQWWMKPRYGKRLSPMQLVLRGDLNKSIFDAYRKEFAGVQTFLLVPAVAMDAGHQLQFMEVSLQAG